MFKNRVYKWFKRHYILGLDYWNKSQKMIDLNGGSC